MFTVLWTQGPECLIHVLVNSKYKCGCGLARGTDCFRSFLFCYYYSCQLFKAPRLQQIPAAQLFMPPTVRCFLAYFLTWPMRLFNQKRNHWDTHAVSLPNGASTLFNFFLSCVFIDSSFYTNKKRITILFQEIRIKVVKMKLINGNRWIHLLTEYLRRWSLN